MPCRFGEARQLASLVASGSESCRPRILTGFRRIRSSIAQDSACGVLKWSSHFPTFATSSLRRATDFPVFLVFADRVRTGHVGRRSASLSFDWRRAHGTVVGDRDDPISWAPDVLDAAAVLQVTRTAPGQLLQTTRHPARSVPHLGLRTTPARSEILTRANVSALRQNPNMLLHLCRCEMAAFRARLRV